MGPLAIVTAFATMLAAPLAPGHLWVSPRLNCVASWEFSVVVGDSARELDERLSVELDRVNAAATPGVAPQRELTVEIRNATGELVAGLSGWTWGTSAGIQMVWVDENFRGSGVGSQMLAAAEVEARERGCVQVFVSSFTFQAPSFYEKNGYREFARQQGLPQPPHADVHLSKTL